MATSCNAGTGGTASSPPHQDYHRQRPDGQERSDRPHRRPQDLALEPPPHRQCLRWPPRENVGGALLGRMVTTIGRGHKGRPAMLEDRVRAIAARHVPGDERDRPPTEHWTAIHRLVGALSATLVGGSAR